MNRTFLILAAISAFSLALPAWSLPPTKVGNGDDGSDLEGLTSLQDGPVLKARDKAVALLEKLNVAGIHGLGLLLPEVKNAKLFLAARDVAAKGEEDQGSFHSDMRGQVFARTFAEPHAATRFFPIALKLDEQQLIALHIHEGLHRALPASVREDESAVSQVTLAIISPEPSHDRVAQAVAKHVPAGSDMRMVATTSALQAVPAVAVDANPIPETARIKSPSLFAYTYRHYRDSKYVPLFPVGAMHTIQSFLYPFGSDRNAIGLGIEASIITHQSSSILGPLSLSGRMRLWSGRGFDIGAWGVASLNTLSAEELRSSPVGRDVLTAGLSIRKDLAFLYFENFLSLSTGGDTKHAVGPYDYTYSYGGLAQVGMHAGASISKLKLGGFAEIGLADYFKVDGPDMPAFDTGRIRLVSVGPEISWMEKEFSVSLAGRMIIDSNKEVNYDNLGNLMGQGSGQGNVSGTLSFYF